jgi:type I restriction enzyme, S subunit
MKGNRLIEQFHRVADAPDAILRVRQFVLDLAIRGKLVDQDASEECAADLLERIRAQKAKLQTTGEVRKLQSRPAFEIDHDPFQIPQSWAWSRLDEVGLLGPRNSAADEAQVSFVSMSSIAAEYGVAHDHEVRPWGTIRSGYTHFAEGDVAVAKITPCFENGKSTVFRGLSGGIGAGTTELHVVRPIIVNPEYLLIYFKSPSFIEGGIPAMTGTAGQKRVPSEYFASAPLPLPPVAEQHRIVAKVGELMALCDELEAAQAERERRRRRLAAASLDRTARTDALSEGLEREQMRFYVRHLGRLTVYPERIREVRQFIVNLAIRGRFLSRNSTDVSPVSLSHQIDSGMNRGVGPRDHHAVNCPEGGEGAFPIPESWAWARLGEVLEVRDRERIPVAKEERAKRAKVYDYYGASGVIDKIDGYLFDKPLLLIGEDGANLINRSTPIAFIARGKYWVNNHAHVLDGESEELLRYIALYINAIDLKQYVTGTAQPKLNQASMSRIPIALPPAAERACIVAEVDKLMAICDELEMQLSTARTERRSLLEAVLHEALGSAA